jgi:hypothetical protein
MEINIMPSRITNPSRHAVVGAATAGLAVALRLAHGQEENVMSTGLKDRVETYPRPPFPKQQQPWPGLASCMDPRPDHGEESYRGSGRLAGCKALITGGDSGIGRAVAIAFAREGADVAINYLPQEEPDAQDVIALIRAAGRTAVALPGDVRDERFCNQLVETAVSQLDGLDILVNNAARQVAQPSLLDVTTEQFDATFKTNVYAMFWITRQLSSISSRARRSSIQPQSMLTIRAQTFSTTLDQRRDHDLQ